MFSKIVLCLMFVFVVACSSKSKVLKEIDVAAPHEGHLFKMSKYIVEVADSSTRRFKFYFYDKNMNPMPADNFEIKKGTLDPEFSKANYGMDFINHKTYIEGLLHTKYSEKEAYDVELEVKVDGEKRLITIPLNQEE
jgi:hypothetical protein